MRSADGTSRSRGPAAQHRSPWRTRTARPVKVRPELNSSSSNRSGCRASAGRRKIMFAETILRPAAWRPPVTPGDADEGEAAIRPEVQLVDQIRSIAPGGEPLDGHVPRSVTRATI